MRDIVDKVTENTLIPVVAVAILFVSAAAVGYGVRFIYCLFAEMGCRP